MLQPLRTPLGKIVVAEARRRRARKSEFVLAQGTLTHSEESVRLIGVLSEFDEYQPFSLHVSGTAFGDNPPLAVYYRVVSPGPLRLSRTNQVYWGTLKQSFLLSFRGRVNAFREQKSSAMLSHLEQDGRLVRLANDSANGCNWGVVIFGVGRSTESSDPFDVTKKEVSG